MGSDALWQWLLLPALAETELVYFIGSAIFSLHPSIVYCLMPCTVYMIQLEIKFPLHVALNSHLL